MDGLTPQRKKIVYENATKPIHKSSHKIGFSVYLQLFIAYANEQKSVPKGEVEHKHIIGTVFYPAFLILPQLAHVCFHLFV